MKKIAVIEEGLGLDLHQPESSSMIAHGVVRDTFPNERLQPFSMVSVQIHKSNGKLTTRHPHNMRRFQDKLR